MIKGRLKIRVSADQRVFLKAFMAAEEPIARAATAAIKEAGNHIKIAARAQIASAGFGRKWQNALRVDLYPRGRTVSINAAAHIYHKIHYANVFEEGARIRGDPLLWLPLPTAPDKIGRFRATPRRYSDLIGPLQYVSRPGKPPLLVAKLALTRQTAAKSDRGQKLTQRSLRTAGAGGGSRRVYRSIPMFVGIDTVKLRKRFSITRIVRGAADDLAVLYHKHFATED
jgi:hypothetical protein